MLRLRPLVSLILEDSSDELVKIARNPNGLISPKGEVFAIPSLEHTDWLVKHVPKFKSFRKRLDNADSEEWSVLYEAIFAEAYKDGWIRIAGGRGTVGFRGNKQALARQSSLINDIIMFVESVQKRPVRVFKEPIK